MKRIPPSGLRILLAALLLLTGELLTGALVPVNAAPPSGNTCLSASEALLLDRINTFRQVNGLAPLIASPSSVFPSAATVGYHPSSRPDTDGGPRVDS